MSGRKRWFVAIIRREKGTGRFRLLQVEAPGEARIGRELFEDAPLGGAIGGRKTADRGGYREEVFMPETGAGQDHEPAGRRIARPQAKAVEEWCFEGKPPCVSPGNPMASEIFAPGSEAQLPDAGIGDEEGTGAIEGGWLSLDICRVDGSVTGYVGAAIHSRAIVAGIIFPFPSGTTER